MSASSAAHPPPRTRLYLIPGATEEVRTPSSRVTQVGLDF